MLALSPDPRNSLRTAPAGPKRPTDPRPLRLTNVGVTCSIGIDDMHARDQRDLLGLLHRHLTKRFGCHTAILYGSRARGDWDVASDIDVIAFHDGSQAGQVAHRWRGLHLDLFLYPTATPPSPDWRRLQGGSVLFQRTSTGDEVLSAVEAMVAAGPERLSDDEARTRRLWAEKMLARAVMGGPEGDYRRHWLLMALLEDYFALRGEWYVGPKHSLALLERERPRDFALLGSALNPCASIADIRAAVRMVTDQPPEPPDQSPTCISPK